MEKAQHCVASVLWGQALRKKGQVWQSYACDTPEEGAGVTPSISAVIPLMFRANFLAKTRRMETFPPHLPVLIAEN